MSDDDGRRGLSRPWKLVLALVLVAAAVFVLFTWVFPWITEIGLSPALDV